MGTEEKYDNSQCPNGFCEVDNRGYGGCLDEKVRNKDSAIARLRGLSLDQLLTESEKVMERTISLIQAASQREKGNEHNILDLGKYMAHEEIEREIVHMYERNEMAMKLLEAAVAGHQYSDKLVEEVATGKRTEYHNSEEAKVMRQA